MLPKFTSTGTVSEKLVTLTQNIMFMFTLSLIMLLSNLQMLILTKYNLKFIIMAEKYLMNKLIMDGV